ncbi:MAG: glycosyltransferase family 2 protein [Thermotaleaceae bacterium]
MKISVIIPAYNEEKRIEKVLDVVKQIDFIHEIIVVSDGSTDDTVKIAKAYTENVIALNKNIGKGGAVITGITASHGDIVLLLDADLIGLKKEHIAALIAPVMKGEALTTVGIFSSGRFFTDAAQKIAPFLSGQRALGHSVAESIQKLDITRYGFETALTKYLYVHDIPTKKVVLQGITHTMKEEKVGMLRGFLWRLKMYWQIVKTIKVDVK